MKKLIFVFFLLQSFCLKAQWVQLSLGTQGNAPFETISSLYFINDSVGFAGGYQPDGAIYKTTNGGLNWTETFLNAGIQDIVFISPDTGYAVGTNGLIYRTIDIGNSWQLINSLTPSYWNLYCIYFRNVHESYIGSSTDFCTCPTVLLKSTDGWLSYSEIPIPTGGYQPLDPTAAIHRILFTDSLHGYAASVNLMRTNDAGNSWFFEDSILTDGFYYDFTSRNNNLFAVGTGSGQNVTQGAIIKKSIDGGDSWYQFPAPQFGMDTTHEFEGITFVNDSIGYIVGGPKTFGTTPNILITTDGGTSWKRDTIPETTLNSSGCWDLFDVMCPTPHTCYAGGIAGTILKKTNADYGTGIKSVSANHNAQLTAYPNPFTSTVTLQYQTTNSGKSTVTVENCLGQTVTSLQLTNNQKQNINMSNYASSMYFIKCFDGKEQTVIKVIKN